MSSFRRRLMMAQCGGGAIGIPSTEAVAGDVCMYGISEGKLIIVNDWSASKYPISKYPPVGIVVVPGSHNHYADGKCAIMSLNYMNCDTPTTGGNYQSMYWGVSNQDIASLPNLGQLPYVGSNGNVGADVIGITGNAYFPSDKPDFNEVLNPYDIKTKYYYNDSNKYVPSPYNNDETFNINYSLITSPSSTENCLADFDGYGNTKKILEVRGIKDYSSWNPTYNNELDYPAASCCDMYYTIGTNQGEWYLPSAGELGYIIVRMQLINGVLQKIINSGFKNVYLIKSGIHFCSTEYNSSFAKAINLIYGNFPANQKNSSYYVRAFYTI